MEFQFHSACAVLNKVLIAKFKDLDISYTCLDFQFLLQY